MKFDTSMVPWWAWVKRFHLPQAEMINGRAASARPRPIPAQPAPGSAPGEKRPRLAQASWLFR